MIRSSLCFRMVGFTPIFTAPERMRAFSASQHWPPGGTITVSTLKPALMCLARGVPLPLYSGRDHDCDRCELWIYIFSTDGGRAHT